MRKIEGMGTEELVHVGGLLRMGGDSLLMPMCGSVEGEFTGKVGLVGCVVSQGWCLTTNEPAREQNGLPWEHSVENQCGEEMQRQKA